MGFLRRLFRESEQGGEPSIAPDEPPVETLDPEPIELTDTRAAAELPVVRLHPRSAARAGSALPELPPADRRPACRRSARLPGGERGPDLRPRTAADLRRGHLDGRAGALAQPVRERPGTGRQRHSLAAADLSADVVDAARTLYLASVEDAVRLARRAKRWPEVARIRRQQAAALFVEAGSPVPPSADVVERQRDGMLAELRALQAGYAYAELVSAGCCRICRADDGKVFKIAAELRTPRLPHAGCTKGLCGCEWWLAMPVPKKRRRSARRQRATPTDTQVVSVGAGTAVDAMGDREDRPAGPESAD